MAEPAPGWANVPADAGEQGRDGPDELAQLRDLLLRPDLDRLTDIEARLNTPSRRASELARILPSALRDAKPRALGEAIAPLFEKAFGQAVRKNPRQLADAVYPIIGPAIRTSIADAALREFSETLNQMVEKSVSFRGIQWRIESLATGRSFSEILLARSLLYSVEQVFLIHRTTGILLCHAQAKAAVVKDADMVSGMLTAIQEFVSDSFTESGQNLETVDVGRFRMWIQYGPKALLVGAVSGTAPVELTGVFRRAVEQVHERFYPELDAFEQGDLTPFTAAQPVLEACLLGQSAPGKKRRPWALWAGGALAVLAAGVWFWQHEQEMSRWDSYFETLKRQPGIVVTNVTRTNWSWSHPTWLVTGIRDPLAAEPEELLRSGGLETSRVRFQLQPFLSLNTPFSAQREFDAAEERLERLPVLFDSGSTSLSTVAFGRIDEVADVLADLARHQPSVRLMAVGHSDEVGAADSNGKVSVERATHVADALTASRPELIGKVDASGAGSSQPLRRGGSQWDQAYNRSVSFKLTSGAAAGR